jgi:hypothetical protein
MQLHKRFIAALALACLWQPSPRACAQRTLRLPPREIAEVIGEKLLREAQFDAAFAKECRRRLRVELEVVARICKLTPEQIAAAEQREDERLEQAREHFSRQFSRRGAARRIVFAPNGRLHMQRGSTVEVAADESTYELSALSASVIESVDAAIRRELPASISERLAAERKRIAGKARRAQVCNLVAAMDEILLLSDEQRDKLCHLIDSQWKDSWKSVAVDSGLASAAPALRESALARARFRGLASAFDLPDSTLTPLLRRAQWDVWKGLRAPFNQELARLQSEFGPPAPGGAPLMFGVGVGGNPGLQGFVQLDKDARGRGRARKKPRPADKGRPAAAEVRHRPAKHPADRVACFELLLEALDKTCSLSPEVWAKLHWAGKLDLYHDAAKAAELQQELQTQLPPERRDEAMHELVQALSPDDLLPAIGSLLGKAINSRLSAEQMQRWNDDQRRRQEFQRRAQVQLQVFFCSRQATLTAEQWAALAELLNARMGPLPQLPEGHDDDAETVLAQMPDDALKPLFGEAQWAAVNSRLRELREVHLPKP